jgi:Tol biopolymer transport system component
MVSGLSWSPDGKRIIYQVLETTSVSGPAFASLWWLDPETKEEDHIFQDRQFPSFGARWSPDGEWLSFLSMGVSITLQVHNLNDGSRLEFPTKTGTPVIWSPDADALLFTDFMGEENPMVHLLRLDMDSQRVSSITQGEGIYERHAAWSPDGKSIAVVRHIQTGLEQSGGDQLWLIQPDGKDGRALDTNTNCMHGAPVWSPDGEYLLFDCISLDEAFSQRSLWLLEVATGEQSQITETGFKAVWLP